MSTLLRPRAVVFDLDGTLVDSAPDLHIASNVVLAELALAPYSLDEIKGFIGAGVAALIGRCLDGRGVLEHDTIRVVAAQKLRARLQRPAHLSALYPGAIEALEMLRQSDVAIGVCTNKDEALAASLIGDLGLWAAIDTLVGDDGERPPKPDAAPLLACLACLGVASEAALYVGDSAIDALTAKRANVAFAFHRRGYGRENVEAFKPVLSFDNYFGFAAALGLLPHD